MKVLITGGTGFIGSRVASHLVGEGDEVTILTRSERGPEQGATGISRLHGDPTRPGPWQDAVGRHDAVINLAGASIFSRWTDEKKRAIRESRVSTTRNVVEAISSPPGRRTLFICASAVGYYGFHGEEPMTEASPPGSDFLAHVTADWEGEAVKAEAKGARVVIARFGIVLGEQGGALSRMIPLFRACVGGPIGSGKQWFSWIHVDDLVRAVDFVSKGSEISGPVNVCAPGPVRNKDLARALGRALSRPSFVPAPRFLVRWLLGEFGSIVLEGQRVIPERLLRLGFSFRYPTIDKALARILNRTPGS